MENIILPSKRHFDTVRYSPIFLAVYDGDEDATRRCLSMGPSLHERVEGKSLLHIAAERGHDRIVSLLCQYGFDVNEASKGPDIRSKTFFKAIEVSKIVSRATGNTLLHYAAQEGNPKFAECLLNNGAKIEVYNSIGLTPLDLALQKKSKAVVKLLLRNARKRSLLYCSARNGDEDVLKTIARKKGEMDVNTEIKKSHTAFHVAAAYGHVTLVEELIKLGAAVDVETKHGETPLHFAAAAGHAGVVRCLLDNGADATKRTDRNRTPLHYALDREMYTFVERGDFLNKTFSWPQRFRYFQPSSCGRVSITAKSFAACLAITEMLVLKKAFVNVCDFDNVTPLSLAARIRVYANSESKNAVLRSSKLDFLFRRTKEEKNSLRAFEGEFRPELVKWLLNYGANIRLFWESYIRSPERELCCGELLEILLQYNGAAIVKSSMSHIAVHSVLAHLHKNPKELVLSLIEHESDRDTIRRLIKLTKDYILVKKYSYSADNLKLLIPIIVKVQAADNVFTRKDLQKIFRGNLSEKYTQCELEIMFMRDAKICNQDVTFYDIVTKPIDKLADYAGNRELVGALESGACDQFPAYATFLERCLKRGKERRVLRESSAESFFNLIYRSHKIELPDLVLFKIFEFLNAAELHKLSWLK